MTKFNFLFALLLLFSFSCKEKSTTPVKKKNTTVKKVKRQKPKPSHVPKKRTAKLSKKEILEARKVFQYHIIAASYKYKSSAEKLQKELYQRGYPSIVLKQKGKFRVVLQSFMNKDLALIELDRLRQINKKKNLWLLHYQQ